MWNQLNSFTDLPMEHMPLHKFGKFPWNDYYSLPNFCFIFLNPQKPWEEQAIVVLKWHFNISVPGSFHSFLFSYFLSVLLISYPKISFLSFLVFQTLISCFFSKVQVLGFLEKLEMRVCNRNWDSGTRKKKKQQEVNVKGRNENFQVQKWMNVFFSVLGILVRQRVN